MTERPLVETARREALLCGLVFLGALSYTLTYCVTHGYTPADPREMKFVLGFPEWVFYGIIVPWGTCTAISALFSFLLMSDHDLGDETAEGEALNSVAGDSSTGAGA